LGRRHKIGKIRPSPLKQSKQSQKPGKAREAGKANAEDMEKATRDRCRAQ
jgi:hypothetical protein